MSMYRREWDCCGSVTETQAWEPESCPFCVATPLAAAPLAQRFKVVDGSQSGHCCFDATVVDTSIPVMIGGEHYKDQYEAICEALDRADAEWICDALNAFESAEAGKGGGMMAKFKVIKTFMYTEEITIEAESKEAAIDAAMHSDECDRINDDHLYDCTAREVPEA